jgi:cytochrome c
MLATLSAHDSRSSLLPSCTTSYSGVANRGSIDMGEKVHFLLRIRRQLGMGIAIFAIFACGSPKPKREVVGGNPEQGKVAIKKYACGACHVIPGIEGANGRESHPLFGFANRGDIAQTVVNTPDNLVRWIRKPTDIRPRTRMPIMGVSEQEAKDIAAYLYTLDGE